MLVYLKSHGNGNSTGRCQIIYVLNAKSSLIIVKKIKKIIEKTRDITRTNSRFIQSQDHGTWIRQVNLQIGESIFFKKYIFSKKIITNKTQLSMGLSTRAREFYN
jgi:hypothetical protein